MGNGFLTWCALAIASLISVVFFSKKRIQNEDTNVFKYMVILNVIESTITNLIVIIALTINNTKFLVLLNRFDVITIISWCSLMYIYIYNVSNENKNILVRKMVIGINTIIYLMALFLDVTIINSNGVMDSQGPLTTLGLVGAAFYIILMIIAVLSKNNNKNKRKYVPLYILIVLITFVAVLRTIIPEVNFISLLISFINLIMIFTIENPDVKMVEELIDNRKIIERTSEEKSIFLFKISQGIREPVSSIDKEIELYRNGKKSKKDFEIIVNNIDSNNKKIAYIINDILGINSFDGNNIKKIESSYNIYSLLEDVNRRGRTLIKNNIDYRFSIVKNMPKELYGDSIKLKQVLMSALINAFDHTKEGFVHVDVSSFTKYDICRLVITIEDSGNGIDIMTINELLDQDLELTEQEYLKIEKLDVDLPLSYKIIKSLGGTMYIKSEEDKGTEVMITLDQYIVNKEKISLDEEISSYSKKRTALIVDDEENETNKIRKRLEYLGYDVSVSMYGKDAIDRIKNKEKFDIILIDDEMSLMNGINVLQELDKLNNKSKRIILLKEDKLFIADHYLEEGFSDYVDKTKLMEEIDKKC